MSAKDLIREPLTGINVVIVGGGIGGMATAIECHRKGHNVRVFERRSSFETFGDLLGIGKSAQRAMLHWPGFLDRLLETAMPAQLTYYKFDGTKIITLRDQKTVEGLAGIPIWRSRLHGELYRYVEELGIRIFFGKRAVRYFETESQGGVVVLGDGDGDGDEDEGMVVLADLVVAADGIASKSSEVIVQNPETPTSSGYSIYRVSFPLDHALKDPVVREHWGGSDEGCQIFLAENLHIVTAKSIKTNSICWMMTHKDTEDSATESWSADCPASDALDFVPLSEGWAPYIAALIKMTPNNRCVNWKLVWRSPQPRWSSPKHRILQLGDACHPFIPTSGSGAVMAMEDGYSLAACLQLCGLSDIPLGVQVHNKLRFERVAFAQRMGFDTREFYHHPSWSSISQNPKSLGVWGPWIFNHDAEKYAYENYAKCADHILHGASFQNTNTPPGKRYEPWTISGLLEEASRNGLGAKL